MKTPEEEHRVAIAFKLIELRKAGYFHGVWLEGANLRIRWTLQQEPQPIGWAIAIQMIELHFVAESGTVNATAAASALARITGCTVAPEPVRKPPAAERSGRALAARNGKRR